MATPEELENEEERRLARTGRLVSLVIAVTMMVWLLVNALGRAWGVPLRYMFLFDFAALAALIWSLVVLAQIWRKRREKKG